MWEIPLSPCQISVRTFSINYQHHVSQLKKIVQFQMYQGSNTLSSTDLFSQLWKMVGTLSQRKENFLNLFSRLKIGESLMSTRTIGSVFGWLRHNGAQIICLMLGLRNRQRVCAWKLLSSHAAPTLWNSLRTVMPNPTKFPRINLDNIIFHNQSDWFKLFTVGMCRPIATAVAMGRHRPIAYSL
jgi:hypothetical protein